MVKEASIQLKSGSETRRKCEVSCNQFRGFSWLFYFKIHASFFSIYLSTIFLWLRYDMIYININIYDKYMMINKIGNFCKIVWGFKIKSESLISETAGRRALKTKFSPPLAPCAGVKRKKKSGTVCGRGRFVAGTVCGGTVRGGDGL